MKPSLERTAVLSKDLSDQPQSRYIIILPDAQMTLAADMITHEAGEIQVFTSGKVIASFSPSMEWLCIDREFVDVVTREDDLRRRLDYAKEELQFAAELKKSMGPEIMAALAAAGVQMEETEPKPEPRKSDRYGQYL
jgi:hypothetical protein